MTANETGENVSLTSLPTENKIVIIKPLMEFATDAEFCKLHRYMVLDGDGEFVARYTTLACCAQTIQYRVPTGIKGASVFDQETGLRFNSAEVMTHLMPSPEHLRMLREVKPWGLM